MLLSNYMKVVIIRKFIVSIVFLLVSFVSYSQRLYPIFELGGSMGTFIYQGDLTPSLLGSYRHLSPTVQLYAAVILNKNLTFRGNFTMGNISGADRWITSSFWRPERNLSFNTSIHELSGTVAFNNFRYNNDGTFKRLSLYLFVGAGISYLNINRNWKNINTSIFTPNTSVGLGLGIDTNHILPKFIPVIPFGFGLRYALLGSYLSLACEFTYRKIFSDYLDGFSYAGNPKQNDEYYNYSIGIIYTKYRKILKCPKF